MVYNVVIITKEDFVNLRMKKLRNIDCEETKAICIRAYEALIKYDINMLPIPIVYNSGILVVPIQTFAYYCNMNDKKAVRRCEHRGIVYYADEVDKYVVLYNNDDPISLKRWVIALGIGYIEMWKDLHLSRQMKRTYIALKDSGRVVDEFAYSFTSPDVILKECGINTAEDIMAFCEIPFNNAREKCKKLKIRLLEFDHFESRVADILKTSFLDYIEKFKNINVKSSL